MPTHIKTGLERFIEAPPTELNKARLGLLMNQASIDPQYNYACDRIAERFPGQLVALFSPQHGFWGEEQANMIESDHSFYGPLNIPVHSLYSETRRPTKEMLTEIDFLIVDLQDVGTRVYTFIWTLLECMKACAEHGVHVLVLDRPNPLGGEIAEGPMLQSDFVSFVGGAEIPLRHGLTIGEFAKWMNKSKAINAELTIVPMQGWQRSMFFQETALPWAVPSPNMPRLETAIVYPGQVLLEGTNLSEGRGTTQPFELCGAPWLNAEEFCKDVSRIEHPGIVLRPIRFRPTFDKWKDQACEGVSIHVTDAQAVRSVKLTVSIIESARQLAPKDFQWLAPPYEYETVLPPIDILFGNSDLRAELKSAKRLDEPELSNLVELDTAAWWNSVSEILLY